MKRGTKRELENNFFQKSLDKINFKRKIVTGDKKGYFIMVNRSIYQEQIRIINTNVPNSRVPKYTKQKQTELMVGIYNSAVTDGDFCTLVSIMDRTTV